MFLFFFRLKILFLCFALACRNHGHDKALEAYITLLQVATAATMSVYIPTKLDSR